MTKDELLQQIAEKVDISKKTVSQALIALQESFEGLIKAEDKLTLRDFLTLGVKERAASTMRNPPNWGNNQYAC